MDVLLKVLSEAHISSHLVGLVMENSPRSDPVRTIVTSLLSTAQSEKRLLRVSDILGVILTDHGDQGVEIMAHVKALVLDFFDPVEGEIVVAENVVSEDQGGGERDVLRYVQYFIFSPREWLYHTKRTSSLSLTFFSLYICKS